MVSRKKVFCTSETQNTLLHGPVRPALLRYAFPIILSMVATQFYSVADTMIIGLRLDADALAAVSNASTVLMIFLFISGGMELGGGLLVAAGNPTATRQEMAELLYNLLFVDLVLALGLTALGFFTLPALLRFIRTPEEILAEAVLYGRVYLVGLPFLMLYDLTKQCVMGCGDSKTPLRAVVATSVMNILLDLALVGPFGVAGAAGATAAAQIAGAVYMLAHLRKTELDTPFRREMLKARYAKEIFRLSAPNSLQQASGTIITTVKQGLLGGLGVAAIAGFSCAGKLSSLMMMPALCSPSSFSLPRTPPPPSLSGCRRVWARGGASCFSIRCWWRPSASGSTAPCCGSSPPTLLPPPTAPPCWPMRA